MNEDTLLRQIGEMINGTLSEAEHHALQEQLQSDAAARSMFRERMDLEAGLRTWAADSVVDQQAAVTTDPSNENRRRSSWRWSVTLLAAAASILAMAVWWTQQPGSEQPQLVEKQVRPTPEIIRPTELFLGRLAQHPDSRWRQPPSLRDGRFSAGTIELTAGAAELRFDSGTNVVLEGPCELVIETVDSARLLAGTVFVDVTEVSMGFILETPEAQIIDEGTQYAVTLDLEATEVHVFDGSVIWTPTHLKADFADRITSGEARRYLRSEPGRSHRIPIGQRQFVRKIEAEVRHAGGSDLLAYDGFENLAGQLRRGRSGFGWAGGWESTGRGRGPLAEVIDVPDDVAFGTQRSGRRLLSLRDGDSLRRQFERPIVLHPGTAHFVSLLVSRQATADGEDTSLQMVLEPESNSPRYARRHSVCFGITSDGQPFVNNAGAIQETAASLTVGDPYLLVFKYEVHEHDGAANLRVYRVGEQVEPIEPLVWTVNGIASPGPPEFASFRITLGRRAEAYVDELRIGTSWSAVANLTDERN